MMMVRSRRSGFDVPYYIVLPVSTVLVLLGVYFLGPTMRDSVGSFLHSTQSYSQYALVSRTTLIARLESAEQALKNAHYQSVLYGSVVQRAETLQRELNERPETSYGTARVLERPPRSHYDTLLIGAGSADGVQVGDEVNAHRITIGVVTSVSNGVSVVQLHSSPGSARDITLGSPTAIAVATGLGGGSFSIIVPGTVHVQVGDIITDSATGLPLAIVGNIEHKETDTAQSLVTYGIVNFADMTDVSLTHRAK